MDYRWALTDNYRIYDSGSYKTGLIYKIRICCRFIDKIDQSGSLDIFLHLGHSENHFGNLCKFYF